MEIGCGARVRDFDGRRYFYFWHYERDNGRSQKREDYVGRVDSDKARWPSSIEWPPTIGGRSRSSPGVGRGSRPSLARIPPLKGTK